MSTIITQSPLIPVITIHNADTACDIAQALVSGGITTLEIVLRTPVAMNALKEITAAFPQCNVGAGTVINQSQLEAAKAAGAKFIISPGTSYNLVTAAKELKIPLLPGVYTPSEIIGAIELGYQEVKLFPAHLAGGVKALKAYGAVFPQVKFCPTGGVSLDNIQDYLALKNVPSVGGSWLVPEELVKKRDWNRITKLAQDSLTLANSN